MKKGTILLIAGLGVIAYLVWQATKQAAGTIANTVAPLGAGMAVRREAINLLSQKPLASGVVNTTKLPVITTLTPLTSETPAAIRSNLNGLFVRRAVV